MGTIWVVQCANMSKCRCWGPPKGQHRATGSSTIATLQDNFSFTFLCLSEEGMETQETDLRLGIPVQNGVIYSFALPSVSKEQGKGKENERGLHRHQQQQHPPGL